MKQELTQNPNMACDHILCTQPNASVLTSGCRFTNLDVQHGLWRDLGPCEGGDLAAGRRLGSALDLLPLCLEGGAVRMLSQRLQICELHLVRKLRYIPCSTVCITALGADVPDDWLAPKALLRDRPGCSELLKVFNQSGLKTCEALLWQLGTQKQSRLHQQT